MRAIGRLIALVAMVSAVLGAYNVFADAPQVESKARQELCAPAGRATCRGGGASEARLASIRRTPFSQTFAFSVAGKPVQVVCSRVYLLVGAYACERQASR